MMPSAQSTPRAQEFWACLALRHTEGLGPKTGKALIQSFGSAHEALARAGHWAREHLVRPSVADIFMQEKWRPAALAEWERVLTRKDQVLLFTDPDYPDRLRQIPDPPLYLYLAGTRELLHAPAVAMVGSRMCTTYGQGMAYKIASGLSQAGISVISGLAQGIDRQAHLGGLQSGGRSMAVLGTGLDLIYPARNRDLWEQMAHKGLILTEFPPGTEPDAHNFPRRNRIISGLSLGVVVVEAAKRSGSLITARLALEYDREVFALPGQVTTPTFAGCLELIREGAVLTRCAQDVLDELPPLPGVRSQPSQSASSAPDPLPAIEALAPEEQDLARLLLRETSMHIDSMTQHLGWESQRVSQVLLMLELKGVVKKQSGMVYALA